MPTDPKWRTIARVSGQRIGDVIAVYNHMMIKASNRDETQCNAVKRGYITGWSDEDIASALDLKTEDVQSIREAMQGRVLDEDYLTGWEYRQPKKEDNSSVRVKAYRDRKKRHVTPCNDMKRSVTQSNTREEEIREDKNIRKKRASAYSPQFENIWTTLYPKNDGSKSVAFKSYQREINQGADHAIIEQGVIAYVAHIQRTGAPVAHFATWLNQQRWTIDYAAIPAHSAGVNSHPRPSAPSADERAKAAVMRAAVAGGFAPSGRPRSETEAGYEAIPRV